MIVPLCPAEKNGLSFLETSALDSTNVETAFQTILTGASCVQLYTPVPFTGHHKAKNTHQLTLLATDI